jgi:hypothetical protein
MLNAFNDYADQRFVAQRHQDAATRLDGIAQRVWDGVGKRVAQRNGQRNVAKRKTHVGV